jgi:phage terminase small subunit
MVGELSEKQRKFCEYYVASNNGAVSYQKAYGVGHEVARASAPRLLKKVSVSAYVEELKNTKEAEKAIILEEIYQERVKCLKTGFIVAEEMMKCVYVMLNNAKEKDSEGRVVSYNLNDSRISAIAKLAAASASISRQNAEEKMELTGINAIARELEQRLKQEK